MDGYLSVSIFSDDEEESAVEELLEENTSSARSVVTPQPVNRNAEADSELINATDTPLRPRDFIKVGPTRKRITHRLLNSSRVVKIPKVVLRSCQRVANSRK